MKNKITLLILLFVFLLLLGGAYMLYEALAPDLAPDSLATQAPSGTDPSQEETQPLAPDFTVYDPEGSPVRLSSFMGKPIVLNFWASWCSPCQMEMPDFQAAYLAQGEEIHFLMVNMTDGFRETEATASNFIESHGYTFPVFYDKDSDAARTYGAYSLPTTFFIDAQGYVVARATGALDAATLQRGISMITAQ